MIKVITGAMFSGKSFELIELLKALNMNTVKIFKPNIDTRDKGIIKSRATSKTYTALLIDDLKEIPQYIDNNTKTIVIDEVQFLTGDISIIVDLHLKGYDFIIAGLNLTSERKPFGLMKDIMCIATDIEILKAKCICCNKINADYTYSIKNKKEDILVGEYYIPICRECLGGKILNEG
jgi:thymidine kinase